MDTPLGSRYRLGEEIGRGGMGIVHRGQDLDGRTYAIKMLRPELAGEPDVVVRFIRERSALTGIRDPNLVAVHDLVVEGDSLAIVMDLVEGGDLRRTLRSQGVLPPAEVARIGAGVASALAAAHRAGVLHRDVKPENVLLDDTSTPATVRLADFGIARLVGASAMSRTTGVVGTPRYVPPETWSSEPAVFASDLYGLGIVLYEALCGVPPFVGDFGEVMAGHVTRNPGRPFGIPNPLWNVVADLLIKDPAARPDRASELAAVLAALAESLAGLPAAPRLDRPPTGATIFLDLPPLPPVEDEVASEASGSDTHLLPVLTWGDAGGPPRATVVDPRVNGRGRRPALAVAAVVIVTGIGAGTAVALFDDAAKPNKPAITPSGSRAAAGTKSSTPTPRPEAAVRGLAAATPTPTCTPSPRPSASGNTFVDGDDTRWLKVGGEFNDEGKVREVQARLALLGFYPYQVDGDYGDRTASAVNSFRLSKCLGRADRVGRLTWDYLFGS